LVAGSKGGAMKFCIGDGFAHARKQVSLSMQLWPLHMAKSGIRVPPEF
jgi:hypothetical protein